jgi:hypothetical protein
VAGAAWGRTCVLSTVAALIVVSTHPSPASMSGTPPEMLAACGHPGAEARATRALLGPLVIRHRQCDLRGVVLVGIVAGVTVPRQPGGTQSSGTGPGFEETITVTVSKRTLDVTVTAAVTP